MPYWKVDRTVATWIVMGFAAAFGVCALCFAHDKNHLGAFIAVALAALWGLAAVWLIAYGASERRIQAEARERVVHEALDYLRKERQSTPGDRTSERDDLADRLQALASKALDGSRAD